MSLKGKINYQAIFIYITLRYLALDMRIKRVADYMVAFLAVLLEGA